jgi:hypothetical protein
MKRRYGFSNSLTKLFDYVMDSINFESEALCLGCIRRLVDKILQLYKQ